MALPSYENTLQYIGAKTTEKWICKSWDKRLCVEIGDWLLFKEGSWHKITTKDQIDHYVDSINEGALFVVEELQSAQDFKYIIGHCFNGPKTKAERIKMSVSSTKNTHR